MCRCCQSCLEDLYWNCIEEKFCFDKSIAEYNPDEDDDEFVSKNNIKIVSNGGQDNNNLAPIRCQPMRRNESSLFSNAKIHEEDVRREIQTNIPILAPEIISVFNNSQIFQEPQKLSRVNTLTPIHLPTTARDKQMAKEQRKLLFTLEDNVIGSKSTEQQQQQQQQHEHENTTLTSITSSEVILAANTLTTTQLTEALNSSSSTTIEKKIKFTLADSTPIEISSNKSPTAFCPIIEKDEDELDDAGAEESAEGVQNNTSITSLNRSNDGLSNCSSSNTINVGGEEVTLRPKFRLGGDDSSHNLNVKRSPEHKQLRSVHSMPHIRVPTVRSVSSETDIFSITGSGLYGQLSMTPEVPSISYANLPKNYEDTPTVEKYRETMSLFQLQTFNKERADSQIVDYSMPRYFKKTLAHSVHNLEEYGAEHSQQGVRRTHSKAGSKESVHGHHHHHHHHQGSGGGGTKKMEKSRRLKQLRDNLPPLVIVHRHHHKKDEGKHAH